MEPITWSIESIEELSREALDVVGLIRVRLSAWYETPVGDRAAPRCILDLQLWLPWVPTLTLEQIEAQAYASARDVLPHFAAAIPPPHP